MRELKHRKVKGFNGRGNIAVKNTLDIFFSGIRNLGIAIACEILQHVNKVIFRSERNILEVNRTFVVIIKIIDRDFSRRRFRIVNRCARDFTSVRLGSCGCSDRIRKLVRLNLQKIGVEDNLFIRSGLAHIVVFRRNVIYRNGTEHRDHRHTIVYNGIRRNDSLGTLDDPLFENLAGNERILRHLSNRLTCGTEILRQTLLHRTVIIKDHEVN